MLIYRGNQSFRLSDAELENAHLECQRKGLQGRFHGFQRNFGGKEGGFFNGLRPCGLFLIRALWH